MGTIPRGIEVLVKKAAVDPDFRKLLLEKRAEAADEIGLQLEPSEVAMLNATPRAQLDAIIAQTVVHPKLRPIFLGTVAAVMIAAIGLPAAARSCARSHEQTRGIGPDRPEGETNALEEPDAASAGSNEEGDTDVPATLGIQPDRPESGGAE